MCTVTYIPPVSGNSFILTSNRDEKEKRLTVPPAKYKHDMTILVYPKDLKAGGSWIAINDKGKISCLLNGGYTLHKKKDYYAVSRGKLLLDFTASDLSPSQFFEKQDLENVEPFTIISFQESDCIIQNFNEFIWDGNKKNIRKLDTKSPYIWSSVTLYNQKQRMMRKEWFTSFYKEYRDKLTPGNLRAFHTGKHTNDSTFNVIMHRTGGLKTVSIAQVTLEGSQHKMLYKDLLNTTEYELIL